MPFVPRAHEAHRSPQHITSENAHAACHRTSDRADRSALLPRPEAPRRSALMDASEAVARSLDLEPLQQPVDVFEFVLWTQAFAGPFAQLFQNFARALRVDRIRHFHRVAEVRPLRALRPPERIARG